MLNIASAKDDETDPGNIIATFEALNEKTGRTITWRWARNSKLAICGACYLRDCFADDPDVSLEDCPVAMMMHYGLSQEKIIEICQPAVEANWDEFGRFSEAVTPDEVHEQCQRLAGTKSLQPTG